MSNVKKMSGTDFGVLKKSGVLVLFCLLSGCALFPPPPAQCSGQFKPINVPAENNATLNKSPADSNVDDKAGDPDKAPRSDEGAIDGK